ncbi:gas vesicle protein [Streptomyces sp. NPDC000134]|uniref:gas vesicle protein GvpO n=1 Tax=Streptomyces sp. NPDC000134 TaxID=3364536 RepID=UPI003684FA28
MSNTKNTSDSPTRRRSSRTSRNSHESEAETENNTEGTEDTDDTENTENSENTDKTSKTGDSGRTSGNTRANRRPSAMEVLRQARDQLAELTGMVAESVSSFEQTEDGWALEVEVLELERVPDTMSLMGSYQVELDHQGQLTGYRRVRRYERGRADGRRAGG